MTIKRKFKYGSKFLEDPNPDLTPKEVAKYFGMQYPELMNGSISDNGIQFEKDEEFILYELSTSIGVKG